jgi:hypothetical protein
VFDSLQKQNVSVLCNDYAGPIQCAVGKSGTPAPTDRADAEVLTS